jgi:hypothetical protein
MNTPGEKNQEIISTEELIFLPSPEISVGEDNESVVLPDPPLSNPPSKVF